MKMLQKKQQLESCRSRLLSLQVLNLITTALTHANDEVRCAACVCLRSVSRSVKNLSAECFMNDMVVGALVQPLCVSSTLVQVAAPGIILNDVWALRNLMFLTVNSCKEVAFSELTASHLASLVCDPEPIIQEQALGLVCNLVDGCTSSVGYVFAENGIIFNAVGRQLRNAALASLGYRAVVLICAASMALTRRRIHMPTQRCTLSETSSDFSMPSP